MCNLLIFLIGDTRNVHIECIGQPVSSLRRPLVGPNILNRQLAASSWHFAAYGPKAKPMALGLRLSLWHFAASSCFFLIFVLFVFSF